MLQNLLIELFSENNQILTVARKALLAGIAGIPDPRFAHEMEPRLVHNRRHRAVGVGSEEDGGPAATTAATVGRRRSIDRCCRAMRSSCNTRASLSSAIRRP